MRRWLFAVLVPFALAAGVAFAQQTPAGLEPWRAWVLKGEEFRACALISGRGATGRDDYVCTWPGTLSITADAGGATIAQRWRVDIDGWVPLPGNSAHWPQQVTVEGRPAVVVDRNGPNLWLGVGTHEVRARIPWSERPQSLSIPPSTTTISLSVDGRAIVPVQRDNTRVTLGRAADAAVEADSMDLRVFRKYSDSVPGELTTRLLLVAAGQVREESFAPVLPEGFVPLALVSGQWPARLDDQGRLHVQVQPGTATLTLTARATAPMQRLVARQPEQLARQEIWSYEAMPHWRATNVSGALQIDPIQADVPHEWRGLPAFALGDGEALTIEERSRGSAADEANRLSLQREAWLDFSGTGWFARDRISGRMNNGWRFDLAAPFSLQRADGSSGAMLVTRGPGAGTSGVEWRIPDVNLSAGLRIAHGTGRMPVSGWQQSFDQITTTLNLPYGYRLVAAPGTDRASGSWISRWSLLDLFLVAIITLLAGRLLGVAGGVIAAVYLLLGYQEVGFPLWTLLAVIGFALIARALPLGRLARAAGWMRMAALVLLLIVALPFAAGQIRAALHPQLENELVREPGAGFFDMDSYSSGKMRPVEMLEPPPPPQSPAPRPEYNGVWKHKSGSAQDSSSEKLESVMVTGSRVRKLDVMQQYSQNTVVQTGAGEPGWRLGNRYVLSWTGPVPATQSVNLIVAPPWLVRPLRVLLVALLALLVWRLVRSAPLPRSPLRSASPVLGAAVALCACASMLTPLTAQAQGWPSDALLQQYRERLLEAPRCAPACANVALAQVSARADEIRVALDVHAMERIALPLPDDQKGLVLRGVQLDGVSVDTLARHAGKPWLAVTRGVHRIELVYTAFADKIDLAFAMAPRRVVFSASDWQAGGIAEDRLLTETLILLRLREATDQRPAGESQQFPPYVRVIRELQLEIDWSVATQVQRLAPATGGFTVALPVLAGERVSTPGLRVREGRITVALADGSAAAGWSSALDPTEVLTLTAPALGERAEVWRIVASPTWHVEFDGVPEAGLGTADSDDLRRFEFHPLPGETLSVRVTRPVAVDGSTRAIDKVDLVSEFGQRASTHTLSFTVRASQGGEHEIGVPADVEILSVMRDGLALNLRPREGRLSLSLTPGMQRFEVRFRDNTPMALSAATPTLALGLPAANIDLRMNLPRDRWLLAAFGPPVGPAVLFWGELLVMIALAWVLARTRRGAVRFHHWLLLGIGFSTFSWIALAVVVVWLVAIDWRERHPIATPWRFNLAQIALAALSVVALLCLLASVRNGLLGMPDMVVRGADSHLGSLHWFADRSIDALPAAHVISLPLWSYNITMLAWALWLAWALVGWLRRAFTAWTQGGYWRAPVKPKPEPIEIPAVPPPPA